MTYRNDPDVGAVPKIGEGSVDVGVRTQVGQAVIYNGEVDELIAFIGDDQLVAVEGVVYRRTAEGILSPLAAIACPAILVKPPAGDWYVISEDQFKQEYAIHVDAPKLSKVVVAGDKIVTTRDASKNPVAKKAPAKKATSKK